MNLESRRNPGDEYPPDTLTPSLFADAERTQNHPPNVYYLDGRARLAAELPYSRGMLAQDPKREHERENMGYFTGATSSNIELHLGAGDSIHATVYTHNPDNRESDPTEGRQLYKWILSAWAKAYVNEEGELEPWRVPSVDTITLKYRQDDDREPIEVKVSADGIAWRKADERRYVFASAGPGVREAANSDDPPPIRFYGLFWGMESTRTVQQPDGALQSVVERQYMFTTPSGSGHPVPFGENEAEERAFAALVNRRNIERGFVYPWPGHGDMIADDSPPGEPPPGPEVPAAAPGVALSSLGTRITAGTTVFDQGLYGSWAGLRGWQLDATGTRRQHLATTKKERSRVTASLPVDMWGALKDKPAVVLKMWLALEARRHLAPHPLDPFPITPTQLAKDANRDDGGYVSPGLKQEVTDQLDALLAVESVFEFIGKSQKPERFRGPVYFRVGTHEVPDDLFGMVPQAIWIQRNPAFYSGYEGTFLKQTDHCTAALLRLNAKTDEVAIILGVYILCKARPQSHQHAPGEAHFRVSTLLAELQDAQAIKSIEAYAATNSVHKIRNIVEKALGKLESVGFLEAWGLKEKGGTPPAPDDLDSADAIAKAFPVRERKGAFYRWASSTVCLDLSAPNREAQALSRSNKPAPRRKPTPKTA